MTKLNTAPNHPDLQRALAAHNARVAELREVRRSSLGFITGTLVIANSVQVVRGEQPELPIHSEPGALRGDVPLSRTERSEV